MFYADMTEKKIYWPNQLILQIHAINTNVRLSKVKINHDIRY